MTVVEFHETAFEGQQRAGVAVLEADQFAAANFDFQFGIGGLDRVPLRVGQEEFRKEILAAVGDGFFFVADPDCGGSAGRDPAGAGDLTTLRIVADRLQFSRLEPCRFVSL